jgi:hypothetical protein
MEAKERTPAAERLVDIRYVCAGCGMETKRTIADEARWVAAAVICRAWTHHQHLVAIVRSVRSRVLSTSKWNHNVEALTEFWKWGGPLFLGNRNRKGDPFARRGVARALLFPVGRGLPPWDGTALHELVVQEGPSEGTTGAFKGARGARWGLVEAWGFW